MDSLAVSPVPHISNSLRACTTCVRAKAKCVPSNDFHDGNCQRCYRLQKPCEPPAARAKPEARKRKASDVPRVSKARVEKLEEKLDDLVSLLKSSKHSEKPSIISPPPTVAQSIPGMPVSLVRDVNGPSSSVAQIADDWDERLHNGGPIGKRFALPNNDAGPLNFPPSLGSTVSDFQVEPVNLPFQTPDDVLNSFRNEMTFNFPFITIAEDISAEDLRKSQPSLYTAVMSVASRDSVKQRELGKILVQQLAERIHVNQERTMDLLLAVLTYAGWCAHHFYSIPSLTGLLASAHTLVGDLGINRPGAKEESGPFKNNLQFFCGVKLRDTVRTLEERRAVLGCWYLTTVVSNFFHRLDIPLWTAYLEECCEVLKDCGTKPCDLYAVGLVRIQLLAERISKSPWHAKQNNAGVGICPPPALYFKAIEENIEELRRNFCTLEICSVPLRLALDNVRVLLYKIGLSKSTALTSFSNTDFNRLELLFKCVEAAKSFFQTFLSVPPESFLSVTVPMCIQVTVNLGIAQLMATYDHPEWDLTWLRRNIWFPDVLREIEKKYELVKAAVGFDPHTSERIDIYSQTAVKMGWIRENFEIRSGDLSNPDPTFTSQPAVGDFLDLDDVWMRDILLPWEFQSLT